MIICLDWEYIKIQTWISKTKCETLYGPFPEDFEPLLEEIGMMRHFDPSNRTRDISGFLRHPLFVQHNLHYNPHLGSIYSNGVEAQNIVSPELRKMFSILMKWILEVCIEYDTSLAVLSTALDLIRRLQHRYPQYTTKENLQLYGCVCLTIAMAINGFEEPESQWQTYISDNSISMDKFTTAFLDVLNKENGRFEYLHIYHIAKNKEAFLMALENMLDTDMFYEDGIMSSENIAYNAIEHYPNDGRKQIYLGHINGKCKAISENIEKDLKSM
jgi:hypothetical protein